MATIDELLKQNTQTFAKQTGSVSSSVLGNAYKSARTDAINQMYDAQKTARENELKSAYEQNLSNYQAAKDKIAPQYQTSANDLATQYERNRRNFNQQAIGNGLNTGAGSQAALAQNSAYLKSFGKLRASEGEAQSEAERKIADEKARYNNALASELAKINAARDQALLDEYNNAYQIDLQNAQILAQYGDFSGFAALYGKEAADNMAALWNIQYPDAAYNLGRIDAEQYYSITGAYPAGYKSAQRTSYVNGPNVNPYSARESLEARGAVDNLKAVVAQYPQLSPNDLYKAATGGGYTGSAPLTSSYIESLK